MGSALAWARRAWECDPRVIRGGLLERRAAVDRRAAELMAANDAELKQRLERLFRGASLSLPDDIEAMRKPPDDVA